MIFGYARVSTADQNLDYQINALEKADCGLIFSEKISGTTESRPELDKLLKTVRPGDTVVVARFFRLGRSRDHLIDLITWFGKNKITFKALDLGVDTSTPAGKLIVNIFSGLSEYIREEILEKTAAGRELAKARGTHMGRPPGVNQANYKKVKEAWSKNLNLAEISRITGIHINTVRRYVRLAEAEKILKKN
ncbi:MAG: recombinase family protein [Adhaeribacter sp.]